MNNNNEFRSKVLLDALPYIRKYNDKIIVVKYGGNAMTNQDLKEAVMEDVILLTLVGMRVVLVHGGGPEINEVLSKMNIKSEFINGLRYTDKDIMDVVQMVLCGRVNKDLVAYLGKKKGKAMGLCGLDGGMLMAKQKDEKLGYVGEITSVNITPITDCLEAGYIPVIATIASDKKGQHYNINADIAASKIASELGAENFILMTDIAGLLRDVDDPGSLIHTVQVSEVPFMKRQGIISGGMLPKIDCCVEAVRRGVRHTSIIDGRVPHSILIEILSNEGVGTQFVSTPV
ncbi:MAG: acetylglutamate kinase [Ruminococcus sp.]|nr:acetylglutamate kinase [Ruminococcus sp.]